MKNKLIALLLIITCYKLSAQTDSMAVIKSGIGITLSPMLSMPIYKYSASLSPGFSFSESLSGNLVVSKKHKLYLGIDLGYLTNSGTQKNIPNDLVLIGPNGNINYKNLSYFSVKSTYNYAYLALSIQKIIIKVCKKTFLFAGLGTQINYNFSIHSSTKNLVDYYGNNVDRTTYESGAGIGQNFSATAFAKLGIMTNLTQRLSLFVAPVFYYGLNPQVVFKKNNADFNNLGINLQLMYAF